ncbi:unnamed protein product [Clavelina lepadiformis]|uniref:Zinc finger PHD-type domain-containing protein n=1 Tax=Clavelina lepadiformis TaxID=159417 RepID=A0ABP0G4Y6_CLALP
MSISELFCTECCVQFSGGKDEPRWVECDNCDRWYHVKCTHLDPNLTQHEIEKLTYLCHNYESDLPDLLEICEFYESLYKYRPVDEDVLNEIIAQSTTPQLNNDQVQNCDLDITATKCATALRKILGGQGRWPIAISLVAIPSLIYLTASARFPETTYYLIRNGHKSEAVLVLQRMRDGQVRELKLLKLLQMTRAV